MFCIIHKFDKLELDPALRLIGIRMRIQALAMREIRIRALIKGSEPDPERYLQIRTINVLATKLYATCV